MEKGTGKGMEKGTGILTRVCACVWQRLREWWRVLASLVIPATCAGCGQWETLLCPRCAALLHADPQDVPQASGAGELPIYARCTYSGAVRPMIVAWKNGRREDLTAPVLESCQALGRWWALNAPSRERAEFERCGRLLVVPAPSGLGRRLRGRMVTPLMADAVVRGIASAVPGLSPPDYPSDTAPNSQPNSQADSQADSQAPMVWSADVLRRPWWGGRAHQAGLSARQRRRNRSRAPVVVARVEGWPVLLVDDVVTTGATLGSCVNALESAGATCVGALTLAAAPDPARTALELLLAEFGLAHSDHSL